MDLSYEAYGGSRLLLPIADKIGLPIDQVDCLELYMTGYCVEVKSTPS